MSSASPVAIAVIMASLLGSCTLTREDDLMALDDLMSLDVPVGVTLSALEVSVGPARLFILGDQGTGMAGQSSVSAGMATRQGTAPAHAVVLLGDNFYEDGVISVTDPQWESAYRTMYPAATFPVPFFVVTGNHDYHRGAQPQYDYVDVDGRWTLEAPAERLDVRIGGVLAAEIFLLDSTQVIEDTSLGRQAATWIKAAARGSSAPVKILALHHAPVSHGYHGNDAVLGGVFQAEFDEAVFDLVVAGHDHDLELSTVAGVDFVVSGAGARTRSLGTGASQVWGESRLGFVELELDGAGSTLIFRDEQGTALYSHSN